MIRELIENFCETSEGCEIYRNYSGRFMYGRKCDGIVVKKGYSYLDVIMKFAIYLKEQEFDDLFGELSEPAVDNLGLDYIVYFSHMKPNDEIER